MEKAKIIVSYKKGDVTTPVNYRPTCGPPQLYKLLSTMIHTRLHAVLEPHQCADQAGFRKTFRTTDHFTTCKLISQKSGEWETDMWVAAIDFKKAFDSLQHEAIWRSLRNHSFSEQYTCLLKIVH